MAKSEKTGIRTVKSDFEELDEKIQKHRKKIFFRVIKIIAVIAAAVVVLELWSALRSYDSYEVRSSAKRTDSEAVKFEEFLGNVLKYSNDGIMYMDSGNELIWNQSFEMTTPVLDICRDYLVIYDKGGMEIYIMTKDGLEEKIETNYPIQTVCVAGQGTVAVLMKEGGISYVKLFDRKGKELANGEFYGEQGGFPIDIALSYNAQKLAVDMIDVNDGNIKSTITFYNFGSVGQNEIDNNVGTYSYSDMLIPEIAYVSDNRMLALGDNEIIVFEGEQKPSVEKEIFIEEEISSIFHDEKYIGVILNDHSEEGSRHITVYDMKGTKVMENDTALAYDHAEFLSNHEICVRNDYECELYTIHSIKKFSYRFDTELYRIIPEGTGANYIFLLNGRTEEVRLR